VKVLTAGNAVPKEEWLNFVETEKARKFILNHFHITNESTVSAGKRILLEKMEEMSITPVSALFHELFLTFDIKNKFDLYLRIGKEEIALQEIELALAKYKKNTNTNNFWKKQINKTVQLFGFQKKIELDQFPVVIRDLTDPSYAIASCCEPRFGSDIVGLVQPANKVEVHLITCPNALRINSTDVEKKVDLLWLNNGIYIHLKLKIKGKDPVVVFSKIYQILNEKFNVSLKSFQIEPVKDIFVGYVGFIAPNMKLAEETINSIKAIAEIKSAERVVV
jgi:GTP pyrophosphokinase